MTRDIQKYLERLLEFPKYQVREEDKLAIRKAGVTSYIENKILSNKFRKSAPSKNVKEEINKRVKMSVKTNSPIHLTIPTGGYKKWQLSSAPRADWSEFFHLRYMLEYMAPIVAVYKPGVKLDYFSNSWLLRYISRYPQQELDSYTESFRDLIDVFKPHLPNNIEINYNVVEDQKPGEILLKRALNNRPAVEEAWSKLGEKERIEKLSYSERNIRWDLLEKENKLSSTERAAIIYEGKIIHDSLLMGGWNSDLYYLRSDNGIGIIHRNSDPYFLHLATVAGSFVQFWVGTGIVEKRGKRLIPRVLSYNQYNKLKHTLYIQKVEGKLGKYFKEIEIYEN